MTRAVEQARFIFRTGAHEPSLDYRTDLYSLGIVLYEMATGHAPFTASDPMEMYHPHIAHRTEPPCQVNPEIPEPVSGIIMKLLFKTSQERVSKQPGTA